MAVAYSISASLTAELSYYIILVLCSKSKGFPAKLSQIHKDNWRPWASHRCGKKVKGMRRKRNGKSGVAGKREELPTKDGVNPMSTQNRSTGMPAFSGQTKGSNTGSSFLPCLHLFYLTFLLTWSALTPPSLLPTAKEHLPLVLLPSTMPYSI